MAGKPDIACMHIDGCCTQAARQRAGAVSAGIQHHDERYLFAVKCRPGCSDDQGLQTGRYLFFLVVRGHDDSYHDDLSVNICQTRRDMSRAAG